MQSFLEVYPLLMGASLFGLSGSGHCILMCGGLLAAINTHNSSNNASNNVLHDLSFNLSRLLMYSLLGFVLGSLLGLGLIVIDESTFTNISIATRLIAAFIMLLVALYILGKSNAIKVFDKVGLNLWKHLLPYFKKLLPIDTPAKAFKAGLLWIFLPCGLLYSALIMSLATNNAAWGAAVMFSFGLGTTPALLASNTLIKSLINTDAFRNFSALLLIIFAFWVAGSALGFFHIGATGFHHH